MIDLALLAPEWTVRSGQVTLTIDPLRILPVNPRRFAVIFTYFNNSSPPDAHVNFAFLTQDSNPTLFGVIMEALKSYPFDYPKFASYVQREFWARDSGTNVTPNGTLTFTEISQTASP